MQSYRLSVDGVHCKQQRRHQAGGHIQEKAADTQEQHTHHGVQNNIEIGRASRRERV